MQYSAKVLYIAKVRKGKKLSGSVAPKALLYTPLIARLCDMRNAAMAGCSRCTVAREAVQPLTNVKLAKSALGGVKIWKVLLRRHSS